MEERFISVLDRAFPNAKTRANYKSRLNTLVKNVGAKTLLEVLETPETWYPAVQKAYPSLTTRKNVLTAVLVLFREDAELAKKTGIQAFWKKRHDDLARHQDAKVRRSKPEDKQIAKYTSYEEIEAKYDALKKTAPHGSLRSSQYYLLLSVLVHLRPKRADLGAVQIFHDTDPRRTDINYVVLRSTGTSYLAMNMYKTSKHYQTVEEDLPEGLVRDIQQSLRRWPREHLFVKERGGGPMSNNTYSLFVQRAFEDMFGRATGVSLLRHIYISEKLNFDNMTMEEQEEEARLMLHTSGLQRTYKWPKKTICPMLCAGYEGTAARRVTRRILRKGSTKPATRRQR
jgi:hypothetical protein